MVMVRVDLLPAGLLHGLPGVQPVALPHPPPAAQAVLSAPEGLEGQARSEGWKEVYRGI